MPESHNPFIEARSLIMGSNSAHYYDLDYRQVSGKPRMHFYHANGYPFPCYRQLLQQLEPHFSIEGLALRPTWERAGEPSRGMRWGKYAEDLIAFLESRQQGPVVGVGHSIGATTTMIAAVRRPDLFTKLVLIDPVFLPGMQMLTLAAMPWFQRKKVPIVRKALGRPDSWETPEECLQFHASKRAYSKFPATVMQDFTDGALHYSKKEQCYKLAFPKSWEAHIYATDPIVWPTLRKLKTPTLGIRGGETDVLHELMWQRWQKMHAEQNFEQLDDLGHMAPLQDPKRVAGLIQAYLRP